MHLHSTTDRDQPTQDAMENRVQSAGDDATMEDNGVPPCPDSVAPEHFGAFDTTVSLYSGFAGDTLTSPRHHDLSRTVDTTLNIPDFPSEPADGPSASCTSKVSLVSSRHNNNSYWFTLKLNIVFSEV